MVSGIFLLLALLRSTKLQMGGMETHIVRIVMLFSGMTWLGSAILTLNKWKQSGLSGREWVFAAAGVLALIMSAGLLYLLRDVFASRGI